MTSKNNKISNKISKYFKVGDNVKVIAGNDKGKVSQIIKIFANKRLIIIKNINLKKKHQKPNKEGEKGQIIEFEKPIDASNVMLYSNNNNLASKVSYIRNDIKGTKRILIKTQEII
uniref:Large ribosomal subunit protein uL24c n=1 Tax=Rhodochaete parvula TaxID=110510 RepID=A0A1X9PUY0_9RHOD|nr:50S ribosomal protein L24 [Rhodochaete parvula]ASK39617.1 ribosomal protein L24 [Rhodochaete parvula]